MPKGRKEHLLLIGLVLLLGIQLTGVTCLGEWQVRSAGGLVGAVNPSPSLDGTMSEDGCPCHAMFQTVSLPSPDIIAPLVDENFLSSISFAPTFVVFLFRPPLSL